MGRSPCGCDSVYRRLLAPLQLPESDALLSHTGNRSALDVCAGAVRFHFRILDLVAIHPDEPKRRLGILSATVLPHLSHVLPRPSGVSRIGIH